MIRKALPEDMPVILKIYEQARRFMAEHGNPRQWGNSSPAQNVLGEDIRKERLSVCERDEKDLRRFRLSGGRRSHLCENRGRRLEA